MKFFSHALGFLFLTRIFRVLSLFLCTESNEHDVLTILDQSDVLPMIDIPEYFSVTEGRKFKNINSKYPLGKIEDMFPRSSHIKANYFSG